MQRFLKKRIADSSSVIASGRSLAFALLQRSRLKTRRRTCADEISR